jgi:hypothetical protein
MSEPAIEIAQSTGNGNCTTFAPGHNTHYMAPIRGYAKTPRHDVKVYFIAENTFAVEWNNLTAYWQTHSPGLLRRMLDEPREEGFKVVEGASYLTVKVGDHTVWFRMSDEGLSVCNDREELTYEHPKFTPFEGSEIQKALKRERRTFVELGEFKQRPQHEKAEVAGKVKAIAEATRAAFRNAIEVKRSMNLHDAVAWRNNLTTCTCGLEVESDFNSKRDLYRFEGHRNHKTQEVERFFYANLLGKWDDDGPERMGLWCTHCRLVCWVDNTDKPARDLAFELGHIC